MSDDLWVDRRLTIPASELDLRFTTSSGPGGQHANKASTRVEVAWNVAESPSLDNKQRNLLLHRLRHRIDNSGTVSVASEEHRSQHRNRREALDRLAAMVRDGLRQRKGRVPTRPTAASKRRRQQSKRRRSEIKRLRRAPRDE
jgi:ribosome-associated protein